MTRSEPCSGSGRLSRNAEQLCRKGSIRNGPGTSPSGPSGSQAAWSDICGFVREDEGENRTAGRFLPPCAKTPKRGMGQSRYAWRCAESWRPERGSVPICVALCGETESERASTEVPWPSAKRRGLEPPHTDVHDLLRRERAIGRCFVSR